MKKLFMLLCLVAVCSFFCMGHSGGCQLFSPTEKSSFKLQAIRDVAEGVVVTILDEQPNMREPLNKAALDVLEQLDTKETEPKHRTLGMWIGKLENPQFRFITKKLVEKLINYVKHNEKSPLKKLTDKQLNYIRAFFEGIIEGCKFK